MFIIKTYDLTNAILREATLADIQAAFKPGVAPRTVGDNSSNTNKTYKLVVDFMDAGKDFQLIIEPQQPQYR